MKFLFQKNVVVFIFLIIVVACTDYVGQIDDQIDEFNAHDMAKNTSKDLVDDIFVNPEDVFEGSLKDSRDKQVYKTVTIGSLTWMAENLNYKVSGSYCYNDDSTNCDKYGRLYTWAAAMDSAGKFSSNGKGCGFGKICAPTYPVRGVCPEGWHFPSYGEWETLIRAVNSNGYKIPVAPSILLSTNEWKNYKGEGNFYGFSVLPAGAKIVNGKYYYKGLKAYFWISTEYSNKEAEYLYMDDSTMYQSDSEKHYAYSARCVKDVADKRPIKSSSSQTLKSSSSSKITSSSSITKKISSSSVKLSSSSKITTSSSVATKNSSSSVKLSSSSKVISSSSANKREISYGILKDSRDGKTYKTVRIGTQTWMAENLNYETAGSYCYDYDTSNCTKFGNLYQWEAALNACPSGWHLPTRNDFHVLLYVVDSLVAGKKLKSTSGWYKGGNGTDEYGFSVISSDVADSIDGLGRTAYLWTATEHNSEYSYYMYFYFSNDYAYLNINAKSRGFSVRCIKNDFDDPVTSKKSSSSFGTSSSTDELSSSSSLEKSSSSANIRL